MAFDSTRKQNQADQIRKKRVNEVCKAKITHWLASRTRFTSTDECGVHEIQQIHVQIQAGPDPVVSSLRL